MVEAAASIDVDDNRDTVSPIKANAASAGPDRKSEKIYSAANAVPGATKAPIKGLVLDSLVHPQKADTSAANEHVAPANSSNGAFVVSANQAATGL